MKLQTKLIAKPEYIHKRPYKNKLASVTNWSTKILRILFQGRDYTLKQNTAPCIWHFCTQKKKNTMPLNVLKAHNLKNSYQTKKSSCSQQTRLPSFNRRKSLFVEDWISSLTHLLMNLYIDFHYPVRLC